MRAFLMALLLLVLPFVASAAELQLPFLPVHSLSADSLAADSVVVADSVKAPKKDAIDAPVYYESTDSMVWSTNGNAYLYGSGKVKYDKIELTANIISMNMDSSLVHAVGSADSLGVISGLPVFVDGGTANVVGGKMKDVSVFLTDRLQNADGTFHDLRADAIALE